MCCCRKIMKFTASDYFWWLLTPQLHEWAKRLTCDSITMIVGNFSGGNYHCFSNPDPLNKYLIRCLIILAQVRKYMLIKGCWIIIKAKKCHIPTSYSDSITACLIDSKQPCFSSFCSNVHIRSITCTCTLYLGTAPLACYMYSNMYVPRLSSAGIPARRKTFPYLLRRAVGKQVNH